LSNIDSSDFLPLGKVFGFLTKKYIGIVSDKMSKTPVAKNYFALLTIGLNSEKISQQELADHMLTDKVSLVRILDSLEKDQLIERIINPNDRRQHLLKITRKGFPWIAEIQKVLHETDEAFLNVIAPEHRACFRSELNKLCHSVKNIPAEDIEIFYNRTKESKL
jgi:MarR family transcriptional regulator for hemolysin